MRNFLLNILEYFVIFFYFKRLKILFSEKAKFFDFTVSKEKLKINLEKIFPSEQKEILKNMLLKKRRFLFDYEYKWDEVKQDTVKGELRLSLDDDFGVLRFYVWGPKAEIYLNRYLIYLDLIRKKVLRNAREIY